MNPADRDEDASRDPVQELDELAAARGIAWASGLGALAWALIGLAVTSIVARA